VKPTQKDVRVGVGVIARVPGRSAVPENLEPDKCEGWKAYQWDELKQMADTSRLFGPFRKLLQDEPPAVLEYLREA
jgi:hypothetical protein